MNKLVKIFVVVIVLTLVASSLFAANRNETAVIRLTAYVPEKTTFNTFDDEFIVETNTNNFSYTVKQMASTRMLFVVAN